MLESLYEGQKRRCPFCFEEFYPGLCRIMSSITTGKELKPAPTGRFARQRAISSPEPLTGPKYTSELAGRECPHCYKVLPYNIETAESKSIIVEGDTSVGKSHFLAALIYQIRAGQMGDTSRSMRLVCLTPEIEKTYQRKYIEPLFKRKEQLPLTPQALAGDKREPLIYALTTRKSPAHPARTVNLIFYDASGEDYAEPDRLVRFSRYVLSASAIIFLADPVSMPDIFSQLPPHLQNQYFTGRTASSVLSSTLDLFERYMKLQSGSGLLRIPIAITLSKSDLIKYLQGIREEPFSFLSDPPNRYDEGVDLKDLRKIDQDVRDVLEQVGDRMLLQATQRLNAQFFAVSATGFPPQADGTYPAVQPRRCLDPVLWILHKLQLLDGK